jgi:hypothetical protein
MQKFVLKKSGYAELSTEVHPRSGLEQPTQVLGRDRIDIKKSWNNFLRGIFLTVLKLFQSWNIIPHLSTNDGIMVFQLFQAASTEGNEIFHSGNNIPATVYYAASASYLVQPSDIDIMPPEKIAFIAYNVGIFESVQKFGNLITSGKIAGGMDPERVAELLAESRAFYDSEIIAQLVNGMLAQRASANLPMTVDRVTASQVDYVLSQLKAAGVQL